jgi:cephalosporin hydroxylase
MEIKSKRVFLSREFLVGKIPLTWKPVLKKILLSFQTLIYRNDLIMLAKLFGTDKWGGHWYAAHYQKYFSQWRHKKLNLFEIGVGGYDNPNFGGQSLRMWKTYFSKSNIYSIDIHDKKNLQENRIKIFQGSQDDPAFLKRVVGSMEGGVDIIIDDGSHINSHIIKSFEILFPLLNDGGIYVVEDVQTSYWPGLGGNSEDLTNSNTAMNYFKKIVDGLNYRELIRPGYMPTYFDQNICAIYFLHNMIFIFKGANTEESHILKNNSTSEKWVLGK